MSVVPLTYAGNTGQQRLRGPQHVQYKWLYTCIQFYANIHVYIHPCIQTYICTEWVLKSYLLQFLRRNISQLFERSIR